MKDRTKNVVVASRDGADRNRIEHEEYGIPARFNQIGISVRRSNCARKPQQEKSRDLGMIGKPLSTQKHLEG